MNIRMFESFVNSEEYQTYDRVELAVPKFESFVNSEEYQTAYTVSCSGLGLRALLIQKSIKPT